MLVHISSLQQSIAVTVSTQHMHAICMLIHGKLIVQSACLQGGYSWTAKATDLCYSLLLPSCVLANCTVRVLLVSLQP